MALRFASSEHSSYWLQLQLQMINYFASQTQSGDPENKEKSGHTVM